MESPDFLISLLVLIGLMGWYHVGVTWNVVWLPVFIILTITTSFAFSLWFSALNVLYRDVGYIIPFVIQLWMYLSPVAYPLNKRQGQDGHLVRSESACPVPFRVVAGRSSAAARPAV